MSWTYQSPDPPAPARARANCSARRAHDVRLQQRVHHAVDRRRHVEPIPQFDDLAAEPRQLEPVAALEIEGHRRLHGRRHMTGEGDGLFGGVGSQRCFGRENLLGAIEILVDEGFPGVLGLADSDFDRIVGCFQQSDAIIFSESHDFDLDVADSDVLRRYLVEGGDVDKCENARWSRRYPRLLRAGWPLSGTRREQSSAARVASSWR